MSRQKAVTQLLRATWDKIRRGPLAASCVMDHYLLPPLIIISKSRTHTEAPKCTICTKISHTYLYSPGLTCSHSHKLPPGDKHLHMAHSLAHVLYQSSKPRGLNDITVPSTLLHLQSLLRGLLLHVDGCTRKIERTIVQSCKINLYFCGTLEAD